MEILLISFFPSKQKAFLPRFTTCKTERKGSERVAFKHLTMESSGSWSKGISSLIPRSSKCLFLLSFQLCIGKMFPWCERRGKKLFCFLFLSAQQSRASEWRIFEPDSERRKMKKLKNIYDANGFWCSMVRLNILKDIHVHPQHQQPPPEKNQGTPGEPSWVEWANVKNAETFFYFSNLYPFSTKQQLLIISHDIILIS